RGLWPWPGVAAGSVSAGNNKKYPVTISRTKVVQEDGKHDKAGLVNAQFDIDCGTGVLKIIELKPHGGKIMDFKSFLNGRASGQGDYFMSLEESGQ
ncbi:MAG: hypothetical protein PHQ00_06560, partial [Phycisphaerae bacterium]|nr:hypothetical protein [Phycisphaerae bacterium]